MPKQELGLVEPQREGLYNQQLAYYEQARMDQPEQYLQSDPARRLQHLKPQYSKQFPEAQPRSRRESNTTEGKLFVGGLANHVDDAVLREYFANFGSVADCIVMYDSANRHRGFGFVTFSSDEEKEYCLSFYDQHFIKNKWIEVKSCINKKDMPQYTNREHAQLHGVNQVRSALGGSFLDADNFVSKLYRPVDVSTHGKKMVRAVPTIDDMSSRSISTSTSYLGSLDNGLTYGTIGSRKSSEGANRTSDVVRSRYPLLSKDVHSPSKPGSPLVSAPAVNTPSPLGFPYSPSVYHEYYGTSLDYATCSNGYDPGMTMTCMSIGANGEQTNCGQFLQESYLSDKSCDVSQTMDPWMSTGMGSGTLDGSSMSQQASLSEHLHRDDFPSLECQNDMIYGSLPPMYSMDRGSGMPYSAHETMPYPAPEAWNGAFERSWNQCANPFGDSPVCSPNICKPETSIGAFPVNYFSKDYPHLN